MVDYRLLPSELWLEILSWAIQPSSNDPDTRAISYAPFQFAPVDTKDSTLSVKCTLTLVCRLWRIWMVGSLFREIKIRHGAHAIQHVLETTTSNHEDYGRLVRMLCLVCIVVLSGLTHRSAERFFRTRAPYRVLLILQYRPLSRFCGGVRNLRSSLDLAVSPRKRYGSTTKLTAFNFRPCVASNGGITLRLNDPAVLTH